MGSKEILINPFKDDISDLQYRIMKSRLLIKY